MTIFDETKLQQGTQKILPAIYLIWAGLIFGVSFIATPVKFQAPNLTMPVALEVGKATFHLFNVIEWSVIITAIILTAISASKKWFMPIILFALLAIQTFWLLPILDIRADEVIAGGAPYPEHYHLFYIVAEILKLTFTITAAWACSRR
jgi:hypothetical protein|tara:strand:+ start:26 stop:472 length:447 start_codon:yes stop_codon:yes gene_type:complete